MKREFFLIVFFLASFCCWQILTQPVFARVPENIYPEFSDISFPPLTHPFEAESLAKYVKYVFTFMIFGGIILALLVLIFAGLRYLYSADNPNTKADAKDQIKKAFLGMFFLLFSYNILLILRPEFVSVSPTTLEARKIMVNFLKRPGRSIVTEKLLEQIQPSKIDLEIIYPEMRKFQPSYIPFTEALPYYPLNLLVEQYIKYIYNWSVPIGIILALIVVIVGGVKYMSAGGDPQRVSDAKNQILSAFLGLLLLLTSWYLLYTFAPEFVLIKPEKLPEIEVEIPEGVYFCSERAPMFGSEKKDLFEIYVLNQFDKKAYNKKSYTLTKHMLRHLSLFVNTFCERFESSANLAPEITGEEIEIKAEEVRKILEEVPGLTPEEKEQIIVEVAGNIVEDAPHIYINGEYGVVFHEEKDFKGRGKFFFLPARYLYFDLSAFTPLNIQPYRNYTQDLGFSPRSITIFEDLVLKCFIGGENIFPYIPFPVRRLRVCLGWGPTDEIYDNITFFMYSVPDFGGFEEGVDVDVSAVAEWISFRFDTLYGFGERIKPELVPVDIVYNKSLFAPFYSFKFPKASPWFAIVGTDTNQLQSSDHILPALMYVFQNDERDFGATYVRSFGGANDKCEVKDQPCITRIFVWPGKILKNI